MITRRKGEFMGIVFGSACERDRRASPALLPSSGAHSGIFRVALLTLDDRSAYVIDDDLAIAELRARGWQAGRRCQNRLSSKPSSPMPRALHPP